MRTATLLCSPESRRSSKEEVSPILGLLTSFGARLHISIMYLVGPGTFLSRLMVSLLQWLPSPSLPFFTLFPLPLPSLSLASWKPESHVSPSLVSNITEMHTALTGVVQQRFPLISPHDEAPWPSILAAVDSLSLRTSSVC